MASSSKTFESLVSCIIPVYNAEKYLIQGVTSLLNQTYDNLEIILVDDWSTDSSWDICQDYASKYPNILAFKNKSNSGAPLRGRERGIKEARGEWITFMDCDDYVGPQYIENLVKATEGGKYDIAVTGHVRLYEDGRLEDFAWKSYSQTKKERLRTFFQHFFLDEDFWTDPTDTVGQNLVRASIAKQTNLAEYPDKVWGEDSLMALAFLSNSTNGVNFVDDRDFFWRQREGSGSHGGFSMTADRKSFYAACYDIFKKNNILPTVSVVVPVYNVEKYLRQCVESILNQSYPNMEVILVDDKSPDDSGKLADKLATEDSRIQVVHKPKNEGLNMARASGFRESTGEYVLFVDSDDILIENCIETALRVTLRESVDFVRFGMVTFKDDDELSEKITGSHEEKTIILGSKRDLYMTQIDPGRILGDLPVLSMTVWGALYTRKIVEKIDWQDSNFRIYEDNVWTMQLLENVSKAAFLSRVGCLYRVNISAKGALSRSLFGNNHNGKSIGYLEFWNYIWDEYQRYNTKYKMNADEIIEEVRNRLYIFRANHLSDADMWSVENNAQYLPEAMKAFRATNEALQQKLYNLESDNNALRHQIEVTESELQSHLSIKRSAKLTLGNVKRRINRYSKGTVQKNEN